jgi:hypothetical protein
MNEIKPLPLNEMGDQFDNHGVSHHSKDFRVFFALDNLQFRPLNIADPVPIGRQIIAAAGLNPHEDYSLFAILPSGEFEDVRLDELFDLRGRGSERFIAFKTDREFKFTLDGRQIVWGKPSILGNDLYFLADADDDTAVFLNACGGEACLIDSADTVDLTEPGIEHFITGPKPQQGYLIKLNSRDYVLDGPVATYEQIVSLEFQYPPANPNTTYTMTYRHASSRPHAGELAADGSVTVKKKGTIFNVTPTDKS